TAAARRAPDALLYESRILPSFFSNGAVARFGGHRRAGGRASLRARRASDRSSSADRRGRRSGLAASSRRACSAARDPRCAAPAPPPRSSASLYPRRRRDVSGRKQHSQIAVRARLIERLRDVALAQKCADRAERVAEGEGLQSDCVALAGEAGFAE